MPESLIPSERQLSYAKALATSKGLLLPTSMTKRECSDFISMALSITGHENKYQPIQTPLTSDQCQVEPAKDIDVALSLNHFWNNVYRSVEPGVTCSSTSPIPMWRVIEHIAIDERTYADYDVPNYDGISLNKGRAPIIVAVQTLEDIDALRRYVLALNLDPDASDDQFLREARAANLTHGEDTQNTMSLLRTVARKARLQTAIFLDKRRSGCDQTHLIDLAEFSGQATHDICVRDSVRPDKDPPGKNFFERNYCLRYHSDIDPCAFTKQKDHFNGAHIIFMEVSELFREIPPFFPPARAVILDGPVDRHISTTSSFALETFNCVHKPPKLTESERASGIEPEDLVCKRLAAADVAISALVSGQDLTSAFVKLNEHFDVLDHISTAIRCCFDADVASQLSPVSNAQKVATLTRNRRRLQRTSGEQEFWKALYSLVENQLINNSLKAMGVSERHPKGDQEIFLKPSAKHDGQHEVIVKRPSVLTVNTSKMFICGHDIPPQDDINKLIRLLS